MSPHNNLVSLTDDYAESVETILKWLSSSPTARYIDAAMEDLGRDLLAERPQLQYLRYNIQISKSWLKDKLDGEFDDHEV